MIESASEFQEGEVLRADLIVVGAGMVGIDISKRMAGKGFSVLLLESGDTEIDDLSKELNEGSASVSVLGKYSLNYDEFVANSRERLLGGTGNVWGGKCGELEKKDFESKPWIPQSGWPIEYQELAPYYLKARNTLKIPDLSVLRNVSKERAPIKSSKLDHFVTSLRCFSGLTGSSSESGYSYSDYKQDVKEHRNIRVVLNANVVEFHSASDGREIEYVEVISSTGRTFFVEAKEYVLAAGGLENPRLLLNSTSSEPHGLGNDNDLVGRYYSGHFVFKKLDCINDSYISFKGDPSAYDLYTDRRPEVHHGIFSIAKRTQWRRRMSGFNATLGDIQSCGGEYISPVFFMTEQYPNPESRISLSDDKDRFGRNKLSIDWVFLEKDLDNLRSGIDLFREYIEDIGMGSLYSADISDEALHCVESSRHHLGGTRMSVDPSSGVVDKNCKVHTKSNLFIAGASVFPTNALANPTLTILALGARLADYLCEQKM